MAALRVSSFRVNLRAFLDKLRGPFFHSLLQSFGFGDPLLFGIFPHIFRDFDTTKCGTLLLRKWAGLCGKINPFSGRGGLAGGVEDFHHGHVHVQRRKIAGGLYLPAHDRGQIGQ